MNKEVETDEWQLKAYMEWVPKCIREPCVHCNGTGSVGGGFKSLSGPEPCPKCCGARTVAAPPKSPRPEIPAGLREHMRRAWWDYVNKPQAT